MAVTLGNAVNSALRTIGEASITAFDTDDILQLELLNTANEAVHEILELCRYRWGLFRDAFATVADLETGTVSVTNGSTAVSASANQFTNVAAGDFLRVTGDTTSYEIASVDVSVSPDTLVLSDSYLGTSDTTASYRILRDTYAISITDLDEIRMATYGDGVVRQNRIKIVDMREIINRAGGDLHSNSSGKPRYMAQRNPNSSDVPRWVLWPYPDTAYLIEIWHTLKFNLTTSSYATNLFGGDAPDIAYDAVQYKLRWRACVYDADPNQANVWDREWVNAKAKVAAREARTHFDDNAMSVASYRRRRPRYGMDAVSQIEFDRA